MREVTEIGSTNVKGKTQKIQKTQLKYLVKFVWRKCPDRLRGDESEVLEGSQFRSQSELRCHPHGIPLDTFDVRATWI